MDCGVPFLMVPTQQFWAKAQDFWKASPVDADLSEVVLSV